MKQLKFILIPVLIFFLLEPLLAVIVNLIFPPDMLEFHRDPENYRRSIDYILKFLASSFLVVVIFINNPFKTKIAPALYSCLFLIIYLYVAISSHGTKIEIFGVITTQKFSMLDAVYIGGLILGIYGSLQQKPETNESNVTENDKDLGSN